jgi:hypothetical protein
MPEDTAGFAQGIANAFLSSRLGESELIVGLLFGIFLMLFLLRGRDPEYTHRNDLNHHHM